MDSGSQSIAIVGMACRFPGASDLDRFWRNLRGGVESLSFFGEEELLASGVDPRWIEDPRYVGAAAVLDEVASFDAGFFGLSAAEAEIMDPQQRILLQCAWEVLEDAGHVPESFRGRIGVYAGARISEYLHRTHGLPELAGLETNDPALALQRLIANDKDYLASRIAFALDLRGPCVGVQTACSTSLVAVHLACQALLDRECDLALAGGVSVRVPQKAGYRYSEGMILSADGHTRSFDAEASGTVFGSGAGLVALRRLDDAIADGDTPWAVIRGSAVNNDGARGKAGFTAPSVDGQAAVIAEALAVAGVGPETIGYVEAHGTATPLGDPVEVEALHRAFAGLASSCAIGSVKSNFGHLVQAAGVAGLIKAALMLRHRELVPSLHFRRANPRIRFEEGPFEVNTERREWPAGPAPRRAGVSSFGIGGTNAHVVLEQAPPGPGSSPSERCELLNLSARSAPALRELAGRFARQLEESGEIELSDLCYTANVGRSHFEERLAVVGSSAGAMARKLAAFAAGEGAGEVVSGRRLGAPSIAVLLEREGVPRLGLLAEDADDGLRRVAGWLSERLDPYLGIALPGLRELPDVADPIRWLGGATYDLLLDVTPGSISTGPAYREAGVPAGVVLPEGGDIGAGTLLGCLGHLYVLGMPVRRGPLDRGKVRRRVRAPSYPFAAQRYWLDPMPKGPVHPAAAQEVEARPDTGSRSSIFELRWQRSGYAIEAESPTSAPHRWLILSDRQGVGSGLAELLERRGHRALPVWAEGASEPATRPGPRVDPKSPEALGALLRDVAARDSTPLRGIVHLWSLDAAAEEHESRLEQDLSLVCGSTLHLVQALASLRSVQPSLPQLYLVTRGAQAVTGGALATTQATLWGLSRIVTLEHPELRCVTVDLDPEDADPIPALLSVLSADDREDQVAFRSGQPWVPRLMPWRVDAVAPAASGAGRVQPDGQGGWRLRSATRRSPPPGSVEIEVRAAGLRFGDLLTALGRHPGPESREEPAFGLDCAGVVTRVGEGVAGIAEGDEVMALAPGCLATHVLAPSELVLPKPRQLDFDTASAIPVPFLTAAIALRRRAQLRPGERVLVMAAAGGVGQAAVQLVRSLGGVVVAAAGREHKREFLRSQGIEEVVDSRASDLDEHIDGAVHVVLGAVTGPVRQACERALRPGGRWVDLVHEGLEPAPTRSDIVHLPLGLGALLESEPLIARSELLEILAALGSGRLAPLDFDCFEVDRLAEAFARMQSADHIGRLVLSMVNRPATLSLGPEGSFLITGGLGDLGRLTARRLVERGARHLALLGRQGPGEAARAELAALEEQGIEVATYEVDVTQAEELRSVLDDVRRRLPALRGVLHLAGTFENELLIRQSWGSFAASLAPKVRGAWNLHQLTLEDDLRHFVLFSSTSPIVGPARRGSYAAGNAYLDALASRRRQQGLAATSIDWGVWAVGVNLEYPQRAALDPEDGLAALEAVLLSDRERLVVVPGGGFDLGAFPRGAEPPIFGSLPVGADCEPTADRGEPTSPTAWSLALGLRGVERREQVEAALRTEVASTLAEDPETLDVRCSLAELGVDSLATTALRNRILGVLGIELSLDELLGDASLCDLADRIDLELAKRRGSSGESDSPWEQGEI